MTNPFTDVSFCVNPEAAASFHEDGIVILHSGKGRLFSANGTGASIWLRIEQQLPLGVIAEEISGEYQIPRDTAREHTIHLDRKSTRLNSSHRSLSRMPSSA